MSLRKSRTRTLIQVGGLVEKAGLLSLLHLPLGDDLQKNEQHFDSVATLLGAFCDLTQTLQADDAQKILWLERGKKALSSLTPLLLDSHIKMVYKQEPEVSGFISYLSSVLEIVSEKHTVLA